MLLVFDLFAICLQVLLLEKLLRKYWSKDAFKTGKGSNTAVNDKRNNTVTDSSGNAITVERIDAVIRSPAFWSTCHLVKEVGFAAELVGRWSESCPCLSAYQELWNWSKHHGDGIVNIPQPPACDKKGCRAHELAAGTAFRIFQQYHWMSRNIIVEHLDSLPSHVQHSLRCDWERARSKMTTELTVKLSTWEHLPNLLCGLAHWDNGIVQKVANRALWLWEQGNDGQVQTARCAHAQSRRFLDPEWRGLDNDEQPLRPYVPWLGLGQNLCLWT